MIFRCGVLDSIVFDSRNTNYHFHFLVPVHIDNSNKLNDGMVYVTIDPKNHALNEQHQHHLNNIHGQPLLLHHHHLQQQSAIHPNQYPPRENSPYNNSSSEKESTSSSINLGGNTTFRNSHGMCAIYNIFVSLFPFCAVFVCVLINFVYNIAIRWRKNLQIQSFVRSRLAALSELPFSIRIQIFNLNDSDVWVVTIVLLHFSIHFRLLWWIRVP